jgi:hypothetical protein
VSAVAGCLALARAAGLGYTGSVRQLFASVTLGTMLLLSSAARADELLFKVDGRAALGYGARFDQSPVPAGPTLEFGLGLRIGLQYAPKDAWVLALLPEVSYGALITTSGAPTLESVSAGVGIGKTNGLFLLGVIPSFVYAWDRPTTNGVNATGYGGRLFGTAEIIHWIGVQAGYQVISYNGTVEHDVRAMVSLNFIGLFIAYVLTNRGGGLAI